MFDDFESAKNVIQHCKFCGRSSDRTKWARGGLGKECNACASYSKYALSREDRAALLAKVSSNVAEQLAHKERIEDYENHAGETRGRHEKRTRVETEVAQSFEGKRRMGVFWPMRLYRQHHPLLKIQANERTVYNGEVGVILPGSVAAVDGCIELSERVQQKVAMRTDVMLDSGASASQLFGRATQKTRLTIRKVPHLEGHETVALKQKRQSIKDNLGSDDDPIDHLWEPLLRKPPQKRKTGQATTSSDDESPAEKKPIGRSPPTTSVGSNEKKPVTSPNEKKPKKAPATRGGRPSHDGGEALSPKKQAAAVLGAKKAITDAKSFLEKLRDSDNESLLKLRPKDMAAVVSKVDLASAPAKVLAMMPGDLADSSNNSAMYEASATLTELRQMKTTLLAVEPLFNAAVSGADAANPSPLMDGIASAAAVGVEANVAIKTLVLKRALLAAFDKQDFSRFAELLSWNSNGAPSVAKSNLFYAVAGDREAATDLQAKLLGSRIAELFRTVQIDDEAAEVTAMRSIGSFMKATKNIKILSDEVKEHLVDAQMLTSCCCDEEGESMDLEVVRLTKDKIVAKLNHRFHKPLCLLPGGTLILERLEKLVEGAKASKRLDEMLEKMMGTVKAADVYAKNPTERDEDPIVIPSALKDTLQEIFSSYRDAQKLFENTKKGREEIGSKLGEVAAFMKENADALLIRMGNHNAAIAENVLSEVNTACGLNSTKASAIEAFVNHGYLFASRAVSADNLALHDLFDQATCAKLDANTNSFESFMHQVCSKRSLAALAQISEPIQPTTTSSTSKSLLIEMVVVTRSVTDFSSQAGPFAETPAFQHFASALKARIALHLGLLISEHIRPYSEFASKLALNLQSNHNIHPGSHDSVLKNLFDRERVGEIANDYPLAEGPIEKAYKDFAGFIGQSVELKVLPENKDCSFNVLYVVEVCLALGQLVCFSKQDDVLASASIDDVVDGSLKVYADIVVAGGRACVKVDTVIGQVMPENKFAKGLVCASAKCCLTAMEATGTAFVKAATFFNELFDLLDDDTLKEFETACAQPKLDVEEGLAAMLGFIASPVGRAFYAAYKTFKKHRKAPDTLLTCADCLLNTVTTVGRILSQPGGSSSSAVLSQPGALCQDLRALSLNIAKHNQRILNLMGSMTAVNALYGELEAGVTRAMLANMVLRGLSHDEANPMVISPSLRRLIEEAAALT